MVVILMMTVLRVAVTLRPSPKSGSSKKGLFSSRLLVRVNQEVISSTRWENRYLNHCKFVSNLTSLFHCLCCPQSCKKTVGVVPHN